MKEKEKLPILLSIDPSVRDLGYAVVDLNKARGGDWYDLDSEVWNYGLIQMKARSIAHKDPYYLQYRWNEACSKLSVVLDESPTHFASEWPVFFDSMKGRIAVQRNYTVELGSIVGFIAGYFRFDPRLTTLWTPMQWKGTVPKNVTKQRFIRTFGRMGEKLARMLSDDVVDAIMIAKLWLTLYDRQKFSWQHHQTGLATVNKL